MHCPHCQATVPDASTFCPACGKRMILPEEGTRELHQRLIQGMERLAAAQESLRSGLDAAGQHLNELKDILAKLPEPAAEPMPSRPVQSMEPMQPVQPSQPEPVAPVESKPEPATEPSAATSAAPSMAISWPGDEDQQATPGPQRGEAPSGVPHRGAPQRGAPVAPRRKESGFEVALGQKLLLVIGLVLVIFGMGFFLKYSFDQGWIPPWLRVAMAYGWGLVMIAAGEITRRKGYRTFGLYVLGGGIAVLYFAAFAGYRIYELLGPTPSFGVMIAVTLAAIAMAVLYDSLGLAVLALAGGFLTPVLLSTGEDQQVTLMAYMTILNGGILSLALFKRWSLLNYLGLAATHLLYLTWLLTHNMPLIEEKNLVALVFINVFFLIYTVIPFVYDIMVKDKGVAHAGFMLIPNVIFCFTISQILVLNFYDEEWGALVCWGYAAVLAVLCEVLVSLKKDRTATFVTSGVFLGLTLIPAMLFITSDHQATIYWVAVALCFYFIATKLGKILFMVWCHVFMGLALFKFLFNDYAEVFGLTATDTSAYYELMNNTSFGLHFQPAYSFLLNGRLLTTAIMASALLLATLIGRRHSMGGGPHKGPGPSPLAGLYSALLMFFMFVALTVECSALVHDLVPAATMTSLSVLWTVISVVLMIIGFRLPSMALRIVALCLFGVTLAKVFLLDMAQVSTPFRIVSFLILGTLLVGTSFLYYKFKHRLLGQEALPGKPQESAADRP